MNAASSRHRIERILQPAEPCQKGRIVQHRFRIAGFKVVGQFDPGLATGVFGKHREFDRRLEPKNPNSQRKDAFAFPPVEPLFDHFIAPDVLSAQSAGRLDRLEMMPMGDLGEKSDAHLIRRRPGGGYLIKTRLGGRHHRLALLMKERGKEKEILVFDLETGAPFPDAAFAQNKDLFAASQRVHHDGPFFECDPHQESIARGAGASRGRLKTFKVKKLKGLKKLRGRRL